MSAPTFGRNHNKLEFQSQTVAPSEPLPISIWKPLPIYLHQIIRQGKMLLYWPGNRFARQPEKSTLYRIMNTNYRLSMSLNAGVAAVLGIAISCSSLIGADGNTGSSNALGKGKLSIDARIRYEYIDGKSGAKDVNALGERTRIGYTFSNEQGLSAMVEIEDVHFIDSKDRPGLDVPTTELNQAWIKTQGIKLGRQIYTLNDHRFIGHVDGARTSRPSML